MITIVYDNNAGGKGLDADWGFGCVVSGFAKTVLFDTGERGGILLGNMEKLGVEPGEIDCVVLSHAHSDHAGGLADFLRKNSRVAVFLPAAFPANIKNRVQKAGATMVETEGAREVCPGVFTTGVLGDDIKEQGIYLETAEGIVVITGCAHPGIVNMTRAAKDASGKDVHAVFGGFHMGGFKSGEISAVIDGLKALGAKRPGPCHCSGDRTRKMMRKAFADDYLDLAVGSRITFPTTAGGEQ